MLFPLQIIVELYSYDSNVFNGEIEIENWELWLDR